MKKSKAMEKMADALVLIAVLFLLSLGMGICGILTPASWIAALVFASLAFILILVLIVEWCYHIATTCAQSPKKEGNRDPSAEEIAFMAAAMAEQRMIAMERFRDNQRTT